MKKLMLILAVAIVAAPAMAAITFTAHDDGDGLLRIAYTSNASDEPRGVALEVDLDSDLVLDTTDPANDPPTVDGAYNCFIDSAWDMENTTPGSYDLGEGTPLANADAAGPATGTAEELFAISMGVLDTGGNQAAGPSSTTNLITLLTSAPAGTYLVTITGDTTRGPDSGVVGSVIASNLSGGESATTIMTFVGEPTECVKSDAPFYNEWLGSDYAGTPTAKWASPDCWCYIWQCRGDTDGITGLYKVDTVDLATFVSAFSKGDLKLDQVKICADLDHKKGLYRVDTTDLGVFVSNFSKGALKVKDCPLDWDGDLDDDYNFWCTPGNCP